MYHPQTEYLRKLLSSTKHYLLGRRIFLCRIALRLDRRDVAQELGITDIELKEIENFETVPDGAQLHRIANFFGLKPKDLVCMIE